MDILLSAGGLIARLAGGEALVRGAPDIAVGNVLGSNIGNSLLILGLCALVAPLSATGTGFRRDAAVTPWLTATIAAMYVRSAALVRTGVLEERIAGLLRGLIWPS